MKNFCIKSFLITRIFYLIFAQLIFQTGFISKRDFSADMISDSKIDNISYIENPRRIPLSPGSGRRSPRAR